MLPKQYTSKNPDPEQTRLRVKTLAHSNIACHAINVSGPGRKKTGDAMFTHCHVLAQQIHSIK